MKGFFNLLFLQIIKHFFKTYFFKFKNKIKYIAKFAFLFFIFYEILM
jgi:hypothetical protein